MNMSEKESTKKNDYLYEFNSWEDENLKLKLLRGIYCMVLNSLVQYKKAIYPLIKTPANDLIAQAQSGTGKTGTFTIGALQRVNEEKYYTNYYFGSYSRVG